MAANQTLRRATLRRAARRYGRAWALAALALLLAPPALAAGGEAGQATPWLRLLGRLHPVVVHFPIALVMAAGVFELAGAIRARARRAAALVREVVVGGRGAGAPPQAASPAAAALLALGAGGAALAAMCGWLNAEFEPQSRSAADILFWHRWIGVGVAGAAAIGAALGLAQLRFAARWPRVGYRLALAACIPVIGYGGHLGGMLVYGTDYYTGVFAQRGARPAASAPAAGMAAGPAAEVDFATRIRPIFENSCMHCHGEAKQRGNLRLDGEADDLAKLEVIVPGDPGESELYRRITLPADDDDVMPADDEPLAAEKIALIRAWIEQLPPREAAPTSAPASAPDGDEPELGDGGGTARAAPAASAPAGPARELTDSERAKIERALAALHDRGAAAWRVSIGAERVEVNLSVLATRCTDAELALLTGLEPVLERLDLSGTAITDAGLARLSGFSGLRRLNLSRTAISDAGANALAALPALEHLSVFGTQIGDDGLSALAKAPKLTRLFLGRTKVTPAAVGAIAADHPNLRIEGEAAASAPAAVARRPRCCVDAEAHGRSCDHECCVAAAARGEACPKCPAE